jgi:hypothetical protein
MSNWDYDLSPNEIDGDYEILRDYYVLTCTDPHRLAELGQQLRTAYRTWVDDGIAELNQYLETMW